MPFTYIFLHYMLSSLYVAPPNLSGQSPVNCTNFFALEVIFLYPAMYVSVYCQFVPKDVISYVTEST